VHILQKLQPTFTNFSMSEENIKTASFESVPAKPDEGIIVSIV
jgi:hypothetical protein